MIKYQLKNRGKSLILIQINKMKGVKVFISDSTELPSRHNHRYAFGDLDADEKLKSLQNPEVTEMLSEHNAFRIIVDPLHPSRHKLIYNGN
jgi:hypothetical protein